MVSNLKNKCKNRCSFLMERNYIVARRENCLRIKKSDNMDVKKKPVIYLYKTWIYPTYRVSVRNRSRGPGFDSRRFQIF
jgi:hypothetical protein